MARRRSSLESDWRQAGTAVGLLSLLFPDHRTPETPGVRRKLRLVLCGAARTVWHRLPHDDLRWAVEVAEWFADDRASRRELDAARQAVGRRLHAAGVEQSVRAVTATFGRGDESMAAVGPLAAAEYAVAAGELVRACCERSVTVARTAGRVLAEFPRLAAPPAAWEVGVMTAWQSVTVGPDPAAEVVRDLFGGPTQYRFSETWRTATIAALAEGIAAEAAFDRLPVLADALEDAGCDDERVLDHCRGGGPHFRGCWVADGLAGR